MRAEEVVVIASLVTMAVLLFTVGWVIGSPVRSDWVVGKIKQLF